MQQRTLLTIRYFALFFLLLSGCMIFKSRNYIPFEFSDASYYSWFARDSESGTNIQIRLRNVDPDVKFDSIVFRNVKVPVNSSEEGDMILLESVIPGGSGRFETEKERVGESDRLIYNYRGRRQVYIISNIRREKMRYYL
jgi:hypothetical protein